MKSNHRKGQRVSWLTMNGTIKQVNEDRMCLVKWDHGLLEWVPDQDLKPERKEWNEQ